MVKKCEHCRNPFEAPNPQARYCGKKCKNRAARQRYYHAHRSKVLAYQKTYYIRKEVK